MKNLSINIELDSIEKEFKDKQVIKNINLKIYSGTIVSLLGINGAGKSTLIKMILGLESPTKGHIFLNGLSPRLPQSRVQVGALLQTTQLVDELTGRETINMIAKHYPINFPISKLIINFSLESFLDKRIKNLSVGQKRRIALALAFVGNPKIVFLDEPTVGLDVESRIKLWQFIRDYRKADTTIFLTTHYLEEAEALSDRILLLQNGSITADGSVSEISSRFAKSKVLFRMPKATEWIMSHKHLQKINDEHYAIETNDADDLVRNMVINNVPFMDLQVNKSSLEDIFVKLVEGAK